MLELTSISENTLINSLWEQAAAQGITVVVASGDMGSAGCDARTSSTASNRIAVSGYSTTPYKIAVGGTDIYVLRGNTSDTNYDPLKYIEFYDKTDTNYSGSALGYIPESAWNDSVSNYWNDSSTDLGQLAQNVPLSGGTIGAGGGGESTLYSTPTWQQATGGLSLAGNSWRDVPDVSLLAGSGNDNASWVLCLTTVYGGNEYNCNPSSLYFASAGVTSASTPAFAGILALVKEDSGDRLGQAVPNLYSLFNNSTYSSQVFHDVTVGNHSVPCGSTSSGCSKNTAGNYFMSGYNTATGYDMDTGLGSVDAAYLIQDWQHSTGGPGKKLTPGITTPPTATTISYGQTLASSSLQGGYASDPISENQVTGSFAWADVATVPTLGTASYLVDFTPNDTTDYWNATASVSVTATNAPIVTGISPSVGPAAGGTGVTITGSNFTGATAVNFGATAATSFTVNSTTKITAIAPAGSGTVDITVTAPGGTSATSSADQFTYDQAPFVTLNPANQSIGVGTTATFTAAASGNPTPTVQWQVSTNGGTTFTNIAGATSTTLSFIAQLSQNGNLYQAVFTNSWSTATTAAAMLTLIQGPSITSAAGTTFTVNSPGTFTVTAAGSPSPSLSESGALPSGIAFTDNGNGTATLAGTPAAATSGSYPITITASNGAGSNATQNFALMVSQFNAGSANVCPSGTTTPSPCSQTSTVWFDIPASTTIGSIHILTQGSTGLDSTAISPDSSSTLCKAQTYSSETTCSVDVTFTPQYPGLRMGAMVIENESNNVIATSYVYGTGLGPQAAFSPGTASVLSYSGLTGRDH
jgi:hypothetical protein